MRGCARVGGSSWIYEHSGADFAVVAIVVGAILKGAGVQALLSCVRLRLLYRPPCSVFVQTSWPVMRMR